ncbi:hypothetical protein SPRG_01361 [Saprolegnia parasitica CBS 223.65]|uniref:Uncharacterized protein n=1 Tax=Saprolegnia parasitica (strain CBS 223.65) TaxID=695850 RepID=A0A067D505_SAPPC|nr:hypothetical protein SPRG_01361 [Saprolegnia parasitica CBS 223.65]KDO34087.1 hypothetical protein SPRG_01361 [Saprolegnia parasitica CBS 223.65]|eukprot:XP_012194971.1 hypothetical protein SPRG_01361 [Saprolegnia parasitica CBS 223.65]
MAPIVIHTRFDAPTMATTTESSALKTPSLDAWYDKVVTSALHGRGGPEAHYTFPTPQFLGLHESSLTAIELCLSTDHVDPRLPLHLAIFEGNLALVKTLLSRRPELLSADALYCAAYWGELNLVKYLVRVEHTPAATALAALKGHTSVVEFLIDVRRVTFDEMLLAKASVPLLRFVIDDHFFASDGVYAVQTWAKQKKLHSVLALFDYVGV